jgi:hypothetical protein
MSFAKIPEARLAQVSAWCHGLGVIAITAIVALAGMHAAGVSFQGVEKTQHQIQIADQLVSSDLSR